MTGRAVFAVGCAVAFVAAGCAPPRNAIPECLTMSVKGWGELTGREPFAGFAHRREIPFEPLSETSRLLVGDSNYSYAVLLTYTFVHTDLSRGTESGQGRCLSEASLMTRLPAVESGARALAAFAGLLRDNRAPEPLLRAIDAARAGEAAFAPLGSLGGAEISAGVIEHGARGRFFRVEVRPSAPSAASPRGASRP